PGLDLGPHSWHLGIIGSGGSYGSRGLSRGDSSHRPRPRGRAAALLLPKPNHRIVPQLENDLYKEWCTPPFDRHRALIDSGPWPPWPHALLGTAGMRSSATARSKTAAAFLTFPSLRRRE